MLQLSKEKRERSLLPWAKRTVSPHPPQPGQTRSRKLGSSMCVYELRFGFQLCSTWLKTSRGAEPTIESHLFSSKCFLPSPPPQVWIAFLAPREQSPPLQKLHLEPRASQCLSHISLGDILSPLYLPVDNQSPSVLLLPIHLLFFFSLITPLVLQHFPGTHSVQIEHSNFCIFLVL